MKINSINELKELSRKFKNTLDKQHKQILVCGGTGCVAGGSLEVYAELKRLIEEKGFIG